MLLLQAAGRDDLRSALRGLAGRVDGMAVLGSAAIPEEVVASVRGSRPVVMVAGDPQPGVEAITAENASSTRFLTEHLMDHGRERIVFVGDPQAAPDVRDRHRGYLEAHRARGAHRAGARARAVPRGARHRGRPSAGSPARSTPTRWCARTTSSPCR